MKCNCKWMYKRFKRYLALVLFILLTSSSVHAQIVEDSIFSPVGVPAFQLLQRTDMASNASGDIWISYRGIGVLHYDGTNWTTIDNASTSGQLPSNQVHQLWLDGNGVMWMANKLSLTRMDINGFKNYFFSTPYEISTNPITDLTETQGKIFLSTLHGLEVLDTITSVWQSYTTQNSALLNDTINSLFANPSGDVWISTQNGYAILNQNTVSSYPSSVSGLPTDKVLSMVVTANDTLIAGGNNGLYRKTGNGWMDLDSVSFGGPQATMWCDSLAFGSLGWEGKHYRFIIQLKVNPSGDILMLRNDGNNTGIFYMKNTKKLSYTWAYNDNSIFTVAGFYKNDSIVVAGGSVTSHL